MVVELNEKNAANLKQLNEKLNSNITSRNRTVPTNTIDSSKLYYNSNITGTFPAKPC